MPCSRTTGTTRRRGWAAPRPRYCGCFRCPPPELAKQSSLRLVLISRIDTLVRHEIRAGITTIGRAKENDFVISDALVSRLHAQIRLDGDRCTIRDLGSGNGTFLNGERIDRETRLRPGDVVRIAESQEFRLLEL